MTPTSEGFGKFLPEVLEAPVGEVWSVFWTYITTLWPHEFGHWARAPQIDSEFVFHDFNVLLPHTTVDLSPDATILDEALISVGGFEVNSMMARQTQEAFHTHGYAYLDTLSHAWLQKLFFPIYALLIFPADPDNPNTWVETRGDPIHFVHPTFRAHTGREALRADGTVDPELVSYYWEATILSLAWPLLDPMLLQSTWDMFESRDKPLRPWILVGNRTWGWSPGTFFNPSPLGYELYLDNYVYLDGNLVVASVKYGRPAHNLSLRLALPRFVDLEKLKVGGAVEVWDQDQYGAGGSVMLTSSYVLGYGLDVAVKAGWKSKGYALGRRVDDAFEAFAGIGYRFDPN